MRQPFILPTTIHRGSQIFSSYLGGHVLKFVRRLDFSKGESRHGYPKRHAKNQPEETKYSNSALDSRTEGVMIVRIVEQILPRRTSEFDDRSIAVKCHGTLDSGPYRSRPLQGMDGLLLAMGTDYLVEHSTE